MAFEQAAAFVGRAGLDHPGSVCGFHVAVSADSILAGHGRREAPGASLANEEFVAAGNERRISQSRPSDEDSDGGASRSSSSGPAVSTRPSVSSRAS